ncbi:hypothetical protein N7495_004906 [Penicillium taxi]|uniref:uncharacterized protein n=1 Tax=Penicillium taxi TaxID=168475 RepID=UPI00254508D2|nr:uncharacterized protein N7495_004906 [Penicillium taxi]KAJ5900162.1 hypothetical protein N7495_004906 [Penicillium taxi]
MFSKRNDSSTASVPVSQTGYSSPSQSIGPVSVGSRSVPTNENGEKQNVESSQQQGVLNQQYDSKNMASVFEQYYEMEDMEIAKNGTKSNVARVPLSGYIGNFFSKSAKYQMGAYPHSYQEPGYSFNETTEYRHKDNFQRVYFGSSDDRFLDPADGRVKELVVQCTDQVYRGPQNSTYKRTFIRNVAPLTLRLANWPMSGLDEVDSETRSFKRMMSSVELLIKWPISVALLSTVVGVPGVASTGQILNSGNYDPFPYRYWGYCKVARNTIEGSRLSSASRPSLASSATVSSNMNRILEPQTLCFDIGEEWAQTRSVESWKNDPSNKSLYKKCPEYIFVAYTAAQFSNSDDDKAAIHKIGLKAARDAKVPAYWLGSACMDDNDVENEVFRISDIVRGAHSVVIAIGTPSENAPEPWQNEEERIRMLLRQWGERVWTFPEVLLCRNENMKVYEKNKGDVILDLPKNRLAAYFWNDPESSRQLLDHYAGNLILGSLQLLSISLGCLFARKAGKYLDGDQSYALMGLLSQRPKIDGSDSEFQAFARLSLANDSDRILERLMCILPKDCYQPWYCVSDGYGVSLWDIEPYCQIAGICEDDTVLVDAAFGATIHWDRFRKVNARRASSAGRIFNQILLHGAPFFLAIGIILWKTTKHAINVLNTTASDVSSIIEIERKITSGIVDIGKNITDWVSNIPMLENATDLIHLTNLNGIFSANDVPGTDLLHKIRALLSWSQFFQVIGLILVIVALATFVLSPYLTRLLYRGKFWGSQAWLFGFEGYADLETIESQIFGARMHRFHWSPNGSSLSRHDKNDSNECAGQDPINDSIIRTKIEQAARNEGSDRMRIFTLIDTNTMTVTLFEAARPPSVLLLCAAEGGMQRAIACSYQWMTGTCYRETILRMETPVLEKMSRVSRVKLGAFRK